MVNPRFQFYAPAEQPLNFSPLVASMQVSQAAIQAGAEAVGRGIEKAAENAEREKLMGEVDALAEQSNDESLYDQSTVIDAESMFPDEYNALYSLDAGALKKAISHRLQTERGLAQSQADIMAQESITPRTVRVLKPEGRAKIGSAVTKLAARGVPAAALESALSRGDAFASLDQMMEAQRARRDATYQLSQFSPREQAIMETAAVEQKTANAVMTARALAGVEVDAANKRAEAEIALRTAAEKDLMAQQSASHVALELIRQGGSKELMRLNDKLGRAADKARAEGNFELELKLNRQRGDMQLEAISLEYQEKEKLLKSEMRMTGAGGPELSKPAARELTRLESNLNNDISPLQSVPLGNVLPEAHLMRTGEMLAALIGSPMAGVDPEKLALDVKVGLGPDGKIVINPGTITGAGGAEVSDAIAGLIEREFGGGEGAQFDIAMAMHRGVSGAPGEALLDLVSLGTGRDTNSRVRAFREQLMVSARRSAGSAPPVVPQRTGGTERVGAGRKPLRR